MSILKGNFTYNKSTLNSLFIRVEIENQLNSHPFVWQGYLVLLKGVF